MFLAGPVLPGCSLFTDPASATAPDEGERVLTEAEEDQCADAATATASVATLVYLVTPMATTMLGEGDTPPDGPGCDALAELLGTALSQYLGGTVEVDCLSEDPLKLGIAFDGVETQRGTSLNGYTELTILQEGSQLQMDFENLRMENKEFTGSLTLMKLPNEGSYRLETDDLHIVWQTHNRTLDITVVDVTIFVVDYDTITTYGTVVLTVGDTTIEMTFNQLVVVRTEMFPTGQVTLKIGDLELVITFTGTESVAIGDGQGIEFKVDLPTRIMATVLGTHLGPVQSVCFSPDNRFVASGGKEGHVKIWSAGSRRLYRPIVAFPHAVYSVAYSPSGSRLAAAGEDGIVNIYDTDDFAVIASRQLTNVVYDVAWSPDGKLLATAQGDGTLQVLSTESSSLTPVALLAGVQGHRGRVRAVAWSPDGRWIASGGEDQLIKVWEVEDGGLRVNLAHTLDEQGTEITDLDFFPTGLLVSVGPDTKVIVWDVEAGRMLRSAKWTGPRPILGFASVSAASDGHWIVAGSFDADPLVRWYYPGESGLMLGFESVQANGDDTNSLDFSPDLTMLVTGSENRKVLMFRGLAPMFRVED
jgi:WD40 repeat protein